MQPLHFVIRGNQENTKGNPIPKLRMTQRGLWTKQAKRYKAWADFVRAKCFDSITGAAGFERGVYYKPFKKDFAGRMDIVIYWANETHGDAEGIFGSIADALFENDKHLDGTFVQLHTDGNNPRVEITITEN